MKRYKIASIGCLLILSLTVIGQEKEQGDGEYSSKKSWSVGVLGGLNFILGDVPQDGGWGFGLNIQKALGYKVMLRTQFNYGMIKGVDHQPSFGSMITNNPAVNGNFGPNYLGSLTHNNFKSTIMDASLQIAYNFSMVDFRTAENPKFNIFIFAGLGGLVFNTKVDQYNSAGVEYTYSTIDNTKEKSAVKTDLKSLLDGNYETPAEGNPDGNGKVEGKAMLGGNFIPAVMGGAGMRYKLSPKIDICLEGKVTYTANDFLDGQRWTLSGSLTSNNDLLAGVYLGINFRLGRADNIYWFDNPHAMHYKTTLENKRKIGMLTTDTDNDGVADYWDKDPETPEGVVVDGAGRPLDIDNDNIPDYMDNDPFSDRGAIVDSFGVAIDSDGDGVPDHRDVEENTPEDALVNFRGKTITSQYLATTQGVPIGGETYPTYQTGKTPIGTLIPVYFDFNKAIIKQHFYSALANLAEAMKYSPNVKLKITGHTDSVGTIEYNYQLGLRRGQAVADVLISHGTSADRLEINSKGEIEPNRVAGQVDLDAQNRRAIFDVIAGQFKTEDTGIKLDSIKPETPTKDTELEEEFDIDDILNE